MLNKKIIMMLLLISPLWLQAGEDPYLMEDESWISISGTVVDPRVETFRLDYGDGTVSVEMDDWNEFGDAWKLDNGDRVTVYGRVDDGLYETTSIEAGSVYVERLNAWFRANSADEEGFTDMLIDMPVMVGIPIIPSEVSYIGTVTSVSPLLGTFTLGAGSIEVEVDTSTLTYDPLDEEGYQQIGVGDRVSVNGRLTSNFFTGRELDAKRIITLADASDG